VNEVVSKSLRIFYTQRINLTPGAHVLPRLLAHVLATPKKNQ